MNGKKSNTKQSDLNIKSVPIQKYISNKILTVLIILSTVTIFSFIFTSIVIYKNNIQSQEDKSKILFSAKRDIAMNKIQQLLKRTATLSDLKHFIQSSKYTRSRNTYQILSQLEYILVEEQFIVGLHVFDKKDQLVLSVGDTSDLSLTFLLNYSNNIIDDYGTNYGSIDVYISPAKYLNEIASHEYLISFSNTKNVNENTVNLLPSKGISNYLKTKNNVVASISYIHTFNRAILYYIPLFTLIIMSSIFLTRKLLIHIAKPISDISRLIFNKKYGTFESNITELNWIYKIINDRNISLEVNKQILSKIKLDLTEKSIRQIHFIKSMLSSLKITVDYEINDQELSNDIKLKVNSIMLAINRFIRENTASKNIYFPLMFSTIKSLRAHINSHSLTNHISSYNYSLSTDGDSFFIPISIEQISTIITNAITNSLQANATSIEIEDFFNKQNGLRIKIQDNGSGIDIENSDDYFYGISTKENGTGIGLSESKKLLLACNGNILFTKPTESFSTAIEIFLPIIPPYLYTIIQHITSSIVITELVIYGSKEFLHQTENALTKFHYEKIFFSNKDDFLSYAHLSNLALLSFHQLLILESNFDVSCYTDLYQHFNVLLMDNNLKAKVVSICSV